MGILNQLTYEELQYTPADGKKIRIGGGGTACEYYVITLAPDNCAQPFRYAFAARTRSTIGSGFCGSCDVVCAASIVPEPGIFFVSASRSHILGEKCLTGPPDLDTEVRSEGSAWLRRHIKFSQYALHGVPEYGLIDPYGRTLQIVRLRGGEKQYEPAQLLGLAIP